MTENRKAKRRNLIFYLRVFDRNTNEVIGHIVDVTTGGTLILTEKPVAPGTVMELMLNFFSLRGIEQRVVFDAKCVRCTPDAYESHYDCGFEIKKISSGDRSLIIKIIRQFSSND